MLRKMILITLITVFVIILIGSYTRFFPGEAEGHQKELTVAAASDLYFAFQELGGLFEEQTGVTVTFLFGSSGNLSQQIMHGAPIDLFFSANRQWVEQLEQSGHLIEKSQKLYARGRIVLAVNKKSGLKITSLEDLLFSDIERMAIANPNHAPYGQAAKEALESAEVWQVLEEKMVYGENVSQTLKFIQSGNAPVGIIALSLVDVLDIDYYIIDESLHKPLEQMMAVVAGSPNQEEALKFIQFMESDTGRTIMKSYCFFLP
ncbi:molybdate ABC transporter substrate-binding protein [Candidatus Contubernalis alkaliaceticus]|uniref:molybdate ABC transporter substrate-binding protein n=1 Tax=Candidatus Contubernalis alkaliaceticus TaxID=338645 RepID=UPI001F4C3C99|nr:molybdate ABC transporter substrate-binding protein [Candidatus Contubernalis alkalaceticus]UNC92658.1 molybdate ABC transporter substrate-binding protein [Candidatus Contubernalis alkalaceticus]